MTQLAPGSTFGAYRVEGTLGRGGMGMVYLATQLALDRSVALKLLTPELAQDDEFRARFQRESRLLASIDHPNVITIYEAGEHEGVLFISMRYVEGIDMRELIRGEARLEPARVVTLIEQVAAALDAAHAKGLIHRDVKPANVLIEPRGSGEHAYLSDFGLTKRASESTGKFTQTGQWVGTVDYVAPEQVLGHRVDARADVYALGCVLYVALTGSSPFPRENEYAAVFAHVNDPPPSLRDSDPRLREALDAVVTRALAKSPDERFPSAGDLGRAARAAIEGVAVAVPERSVAVGPALAPADSGRTAPAAAPRPTAPAERHPPTPPEPEPAPRTPRRARWAIPTAIAAVLLAAVAAILILGGGEDGEEGGKAPAVVGAPEAMPSPGGPTSGIATDGEDVYVATSAGVARFDAAEPGAPERLRLPGTPDGIAAGDEGVWVLSNEGVYQLADDLGKLNDRLAQVGRFAVDITVGEGSLWAASYERSGRIYRLDPATGARTGTVKLEQPPTGLFVGGGAVWVTSGESEVLRIDPVSLEVTAEGTVQGAPGPVGIDEERVWVGALGGDLVMPLDAETAQPAGDPVATGRFPAWVVVGGGTVWVVNRDDGTITRIDAGTGEPLGEPLQVGGDPFAAVFAGDALWVIERKGKRVSRIPAT